VNEGRWSLNMSNMLSETEIVIQIVKTDLRPKEGSYWSLKIICISF